MFVFYSAAVQCFEACRLIVTSSPQNKQTIERVSYIFTFTASFSWRKSFEKKMHTVSCIVIILFAGLVPSKNTKKRNSFSAVVHFLRFVTHTP